LTTGISGAVNTAQNTFQQKLQRLKHRISTQFKKANPAATDSNTASKVSHEQLPPPLPNPPREALNDPFLHEAPFTHHTPLPDGLISRDALEDLLVPWPSFRGLPANASASVRSHTCVQIFEESDYADGTIAGRLVFGDGDRTG